MAGVGHAPGWALAAAFRDRLWLQGLARFPSLCIVWGLLFLACLLGVPCGAKKQQKGTKTSSCVSYNISF